ncbi:MAG TPA: DUF4440 domain-containing protein [Pyrinomonadaceae bacterium]
MKRCPTCKRTFEDDSLAYCLDDGTPLLAEVPARPHSEDAIVTPAPGDAGSHDLPPTQYAQLGGKATVSASGGQIPRMTAYNATPPKRRVWPWVVGGLAALFLIGIVIAAVVAIPMLMKNANNTNRSIASDSPAASPADTSTPQPADSPKDAAAPADEDVALAQLTEIEKQWTEANVQGDKDAIRKILAEEYSGGDPPQTKQEYLDGLKPDPTVKSWELQDLKVELEGERATLNGYLRQETTRGAEVYGFTDTFVWRDGRWQAKGSHASRVK